MLETADGQDVMSERGWQLGTCGLLCGLYWAMGNRKREATELVAHTLLMPLSKNHSFEHAPFTGKSFSTPAEQSPVNIHTSSQQCSPTTEMKSNQCCQHQHHSTIKLSKQKCATHVGKPTPVGKHKRLIIWCSRFCCILDICISRSCDQRRGKSTQREHKYHKSSQTSNMELYCCPSLTRNVLRPFFTVSLFDNDLKLIDSQAPLVFSAAVGPNDDASIQTSRSSSIPDNLSSPENVQVYRTYLPIPCLGP